MAASIRFLACHDQKVLIIAPLRHDVGGFRVTIEEYGPLLENNPVVATYSMITDLRRFEGILRIDELEEYFGKFRQARIGLGRDPFLAVPQVLICSPDESAMEMAKMIRSVLRNPNQVTITHDPEEAWRIASNDATIPAEAGNLLGLRKRGWFP